MGEFKLYHLVKELLDVTGTKNAPKEFVEFLQKTPSDDTKSGSSSRVAIRGSVERLAQQQQQSIDSHKFMQKVYDLKQKNVDSLEEYIRLLDYVCQDLHLKEFLQNTNVNSKKTKLPSASSATSCRQKFTKDDVLMVKTRLKKMVTESSRQKESIFSSSEAGKMFERSIVPMASVPAVNSWVQRRPSMSWDFSTHNLSSSSACSSLTTTTIHAPLIESIPAKSQENLLIQDLLNVLIGLRGAFIEPLKLKDPYAVREFAINDAVEPSVKELVKQILPLASHYSIVQRFTEEKMRFEFGQVCNALAESMGKLIVDHTLLVTQLESEARQGNLSLHKLWFYVQNNLHRLAVVSNIATTISKSDAKGGKVLSLLHDRAMGYVGDEKAQSLCVHLMQSACVPYMKMLGMWIYKGIISDPIQEFLVEDNEIVEKEDMPVDYSADYWEKKYSIRRERIPKFLDPVSDIILRAGKYLNVIRQCVKSVTDEGCGEPIEYTLEQKHYIDAIEKAYKFASKTLLDLVVREKDLLGRLRSVKHYFLLDQGDFIVTFLTLCEKELSKDVGDVVQGRLESLMDLALRLSSANNDAFKEDLRTELLPYDLQYQMLKILTVISPEERDYMSSKMQRKTSLSVIESFAFSYDVRWPVSLILNRRSLACYQMIFRHLFYCKHVERMMCQEWRANKVAKRFPESAASQYRTAFALRQRMLHCVQNLEYHMMVEVIEPHWCVFMQRISKVHNVDEILTCHGDFLDSCLRDCMLTIPELLSTVTNILAICVKFCTFMQRIQRFFVEAELGRLPDTLDDELFCQTDGTVDLSSSEKMMSFKDNVETLDGEFSESLKDLLERINALNKGTSDHDRLYNLLYRLDFNGFYTIQFQRMEANASG